jgi:hypothetical protein
MSRHRISCAALSLAVVVVLGACGSSSHESTTPVTVFNLAADPAQNIPAATGKPVVLTAATLRTTLDSLLSSHAELITALAHEVGAGNDSPTEAIKALTANTQALTDAIALVYGREAGRAFAQLWEQHTQFFINYAQADRSHDHGAKETAEDQLEDYQSDFASLLSTATAGGVGLVAVTRLLHLHVTDITSYIDADVAGHDALAAQLRAQAIAHAHIIARAIADAIAAQHLDTVKS